jgi:hypothetical protein
MFTSVLEKTKEIIRMVCDEAKPTPVPGLMTGIVMEAGDLDHMDEA